MISRIGAILLLSLATLAAGGLAWQQFTGHALPGCGMESACASLAASPWGRVLGIPLSLVGLAYFVSATGVLIATRPTRWFVVIVWLGAAISLLYLGMMSLLERWCVYCLLVHVANLAAAVFLFHCYWQDPHPAHSGNTTTGRRNFLLASLVFITLLCGLVAYDWRMQQHSQTQQANLLNHSVDRVLDQQMQTGARGFRGRHLLGLEPAVVRLVLFTDYQCGDCAKLESELQQLQAESNSIAITLRQFPLCSQCNPSIPYAWFHPRSCKAAQLAEAAAMVGGEQKFWRMHHWLMKRSAKYEPKELRDLCQELDIDEAELRVAAESQAIARLLTSDIEQGIAVGVSETPFVFLNGVELKGIAADPTKIREAVQRVLEAEQALLLRGGNSLASGFDQDTRPPAADDRTLRLWAEAKPAASVPPRGNELVQLGNPVGKHRVLLFQEPSYAESNEMWTALSQLAKLRDDVSIEWYLYPMNGTHHPEIPTWQHKLYTHSAIASRATIALVEQNLHEVLPTVFEVADKADTGDQAFMSLLSDRLQDLEPTAISQQAILGRPVIDWLARLNTDRLDKQIAAQVQLAQKHGVSWGPTLIINGRRSPTDRITAELVCRMLDTEVADGERD